MISRDGPAASPTRREPSHASPPPEAASHASAYRRLPILLLSTLTLVGLVVITVLPLGATRVFATPWTLFYAATLIGPAGILVLRAFAPDRPLVLPSNGYQLTAAAALLVLVGSALASPFRSSALLWAAPGLSAILGFLVTYDWLHEADVDARRATAWNAFQLFFAVIAIASLVEWLSGLSQTTLGKLVAARNALPLGHSNYTAGLGVLMLPPFVAAALRAPGSRRFVAAVGALLALALVFTSGSRAGMIAVAVSAALGILASPLRRATKAKIALAAVIAAIAFTAANPRTRAMLRPADPNVPPNISNVQRSAMLVAGERMGADRPLLGWGPGTTPLVFPQYRAGLDGGAEDVLQLHSLPVQLWAETGAAGVLLGLIAFGLLASDFRRDSLAAITLGGYLVFALFDFQLDVPVFGFAIAGLAALLAPPASEPAPRSDAWKFGALAVGAAVLIAALGRRDPTPELNAMALSPAMGRAQPQKAKALLETSLAQNPNQEIAHFNLGWLLLVDDPAAAARHFRAAAHLVPDKGGVYFGLGLAELNAGDTAAAPEAFALEALNDPVFLLSPWWKNPQMHAVHRATLVALNEDLSRLTETLPADQWAGREARYLRAFADWLSRPADPATVAAVANTPARRDFFQRRPDRAVLEQVGSENLRHERIGYPVLMRNLDLPPPIDLWVVQQNSARTSPYAFLWPDKGWLPSPLLIALLDGKDLRKN